MWKLLKKSLLILPLLLVLPLVIFVMLYSFTSVIDRNVLNLVNHLAGENIHIHFDRMTGNLLKQLRLSNLSVVVEDDTLATGDLLELDYRLLDLLRRRYIINSLLLNNAAISIPLADSSAVPDSTRRPLDAFFRALATLPDIKVRRLELADASLKILRDHKELESFSNINLRLAVAVSDSQIFLRPGMLNGRWDDRDLLLEDLSFSLTGNKNDIRLDNLFFAASGMRLAGHGKLQQVPAPHLDLVLESALVDMALVRRITEKFPWQGGYLQLEGQFSGEPLNFTASLQAGGALDELKIETLDAQLERRFNRFLLPGLSLKTSAGTVSGGGEFSRKRGFKAQMDVRDIQLHKTGLLADSTNITGSLTANLNDWQLNKARGEARLNLLKSRYGSLKADTVIAHLGLQNGRWDIHPTSRIAFSAKSGLKVSGQIEQQQINARVTGEHIDLGSLLGEFNISGFRGTGSTDFTLSGPLKDPALDGVVFLDSLLYKTITLYGADGEITVNNLVSDLTGRADLEIATGFVNQIFLTHGGLSGSFSKKKVSVDSLKFLSRSNAIIASGDVTFQPDQTSIELPDLRLIYENYSLAAAGPVQLNWRNDTLHVEQLHLQNATLGGDITGSGFWCFDTCKTVFNMQLQQIPIEPLNEYVYWNYQVRGILDADVEFYGELDSLEILAGIQLNRMQLQHVDSLLAPQQLGKLQSEILYASDRLGINFLDYEQDSTSYLNLNGAFDIAIIGQDSLEDAPLDFNVVARDIDLSKYRPLLRTTYPLEGLLSGRLELQGSVHTPDVRMELSGTGIRYADYQVPEFRLRGHADAAGVYMDSAFVNYMNTDIQLQGEKKLIWDPAHFRELPQDRSFLLNASIREDSINFLNSINPELDIITGDIQANVQLSGTFDKPVITAGKVTVRKGKVYLARLQNSIDNVSLNANVVSPNLVVYDFSGNSAPPATSGNFLQRWFAGIWRLFRTEESGGHLYAGGQARMDDPLRPIVDLNLQADRAYLNYFLENAELLVSTGNLKIRGQDTLVIAGDVKVGGGIKFDFVESEKNLLLTPAVRQEAPFFRYNIDLEILPGFYIRNDDTFNNFDLQVSGNLAVLLEPRQLLEYNGSLDVDGKYLVQGEVFAIQSGKIDFVNPKELPQLNIFASKQKENYTFELKITGPLDTPEKDITVIDANGSTRNDLDVKDKMSLLLFGVAFNQLGSGADSLLRLKGEEFLTQTVIALLERETRSYTGLDQVRLDGQSSYFESQLNQQYTPTLSLGKYLTPNLYLEYRSALESGGFGNIPRPSLSWEAGNQLYLQYRLNRNWSFSTSYETTQEGNDKVKLDISWRLEF